MKRVEDIIIDEINEARKKGTKKSRNDETRAKRGSGRKSSGGGGKGKNKMPYSEAKSQKQKGLFAVALNYKESDDKEATERKLRAYANAKVKAGKMQKNQIENRINRIKEIAKMPKAKLVKFIDVNPSKVYLYGDQDKNGIREPSIKKGQGKNYGKKKNEGEDMFDYDESLLETVFDEWNDTEIDELVEATRMVSVKRKYAQYDSISVGRFAPVRNTILSYISEKNICTKSELKEFIKTNNEESGNTGSSSWLNKNSKYVVEFTKQGETYYRLSKLGYRVLNKAIVNEASLVDEFFVSEDDMMDTLKDFAIMLKSNKVDYPNVPKSLINELKKLK